MSNTQKYMSYKLAHEKIVRAIDEGFPLEEITICESIITDRLLSYANWVFRSNVTGHSGLS